MSNESDKTSETAKAAETAVATRRRLLKAGLAAGPVLMTLHSRPVLGQTPQTASGFDTGSGVSVAIAAIQSCSGNSCAHWRSIAPTDARGWMGISPDTPFHAVFGEGNHAASRLLKSEGGSHRSLTMIEVLDGAHADDTHGVARHFVGALLNVNAGLVPSSVMDSNKLFAMWSDWASTGKYLPSAKAAAWNAGAIVRYFKASGIAP